MKKRKRRMDMYQVFREDYKDVLYLNDNTEIDYKFFIEKYTDALGKMKDLSLPIASFLYRRLDDAYVNLALF